MWEQLVLAYQGTDAKINAVSMAKNKINMARYDRHRHTFTFDNYCDLHVKYNRILTHYGENQTPHFQVNSFLNGITYDHARWESFKTAISMSPEYSQDVYKAIQQYKTLVSQLNASRPIEDQ